MSSGMKAGDGCFPREGATGDGKDSEGNNVQAIDATEAAVKTYERC